MAAATYQPLSRVIDVEVVLRAETTISEDECLSRVRAFFMVKLGQQPVLPGLVEVGDAALAAAVHAIRVCEPQPGTHLTPCTFSDACFNFIVYQLSPEAPRLEFVSAPGASSDDGSSGDGAPSSYTRWPLPSPQLEGMWESLVYGSNIKGTLLSYAAAALSFADAGVSTHVCSANRVVLLAGPPGTGKTSIARAVAHKLAAHCSARFPHADLIELNAHSLFSRWFSESGKLVTQLFQHLETLAEASDHLLVLLIDEVESLAMARKTGASEPSDSLRAVNALLTALDKLRHRPNVLVINSTNLTEAIDPAFIDRADLKLVVDLPDNGARFAILLDCVNELIGRGLVQPAADGLAIGGPSASPVVRASPGALAASARASVAGGYPGQPALATASPRLSGWLGGATPLLAPSDEAVSRLMQVVGDADGFSGRALRKLPLQAYALLAAGGAIGVGAALQGAAGTAGGAVHPGLGSSASSVASGSTSSTASSARLGARAMTASSWASSASSAGGSHAHAYSPASGYNSYTSPATSAMDVSHHSSSTGRGSFASSPQPPSRPAIPLLLFIHALHKAVEEEQAVRGRFAAGVC